MSKYKIRIGNDCLVNWSFYQDKAKTLPLSLTDRSLKVYISTNSAKWEITPITISGNVLSFTITGQNQVNKYGTGLMTLSCIENEGATNQRALDIIQPFLFVNQAEESFQGSAEGEYTLLELGVAYFDSSVASAYETVEHAAATYVAIANVISNDQIDSLNMDL